MSCSYIGLILILVDEVTNMITNSNAVIMGATAEGLSSYRIRALIWVVEDISLLIGIVLQVKHLTH